MPIFNRTQHIGEHNWHSELSAKELRNQGWGACVYLQSVIFKVLSGPPQGHFKTPESLAKDTDLLWSNKKEEEREV